MAGKKTRRRQRHQRNKQRAAERKRVALKVCQEIDQFLADELVRLAGRGIRPSCTAGCVGCCYQEIPVVRSECELIADYVHTRMTPMDKADLVDRLRAYLKFLREDLPALRRPGLHVLDIIIDNAPPCPLLVDGFCSVYPVRPTACRVHYVYTDPGGCMPTHRPEYKEIDPETLPFDGLRKHTILDQNWTVIEATGGSVESAVHRLPEWLAHLLGVEREPWTETQPPALVEAVLGGRRER